MADAPQPAAGKAGGFAGLTGMATDIEAVLVKAQAGLRPPPAPPPLPSPTATGAAVPPPQSTFADALEAHAEKARRRKWLAPGIGVACYLAAAGWIVLSHPSQSSYTPPPRRAIVTDPTPTPVPPSVAVAPAPAIAAVKPAPDYSTLWNGAAESQPPPGTDRLFDAGELRYCLAQKERLIAARAALDHSQPMQVARFNLLVQDFNSRCSQYRYHRTERDRIAAQVEGEKPQLRQQGIALLSGHG